MEPCPRYCYMPAASGYPVLSADSARVISSRTYHERKTAPHLGWGSFRALDISRLWRLRFPGESATAAAPKP
jgi:hypothetical protein